MFSFTPASLSLALAIPRTTRTWKLLSPRATRGGAVRRIPRRLVSLVVTRKATASTSYTLTSEPAISPCGKKARSPLDRKPRNFPRWPVF